MAPCQLQQEIDNVFNVALYLKIQWALAGRLHAGGITLICNSDHQHFAKFIDFQIQLDFQIQ